MTQLLDQRIGTNNIFKEVMEFLNLLKLGLTQYEVVGYYERELNSSIGSQNTIHGMFLVFREG